MTSVADAREALSKLEEWKRVVVRTARDNKVILPADFAMIILEMCEDTVWGAIENAQRMDRDSVYRVTPDTVATAQSSVIPEQGGSMVNQLPKRRKIWNPNKDRE